MKRLVVLLTLLLVGCSSLPTMSIQDEWLFVSLKQEGDLLLLTGPNLLETAEEGNLYTYYATGKWIALEWVGYINGTNIWLVPENVPIGEPDWSIDFYGNPFTWWFFGARSGTSAS